ncbi:MAG: DUF86 domain-containing protein [Bacteroidetes bacterium]|nr:MAG: DUF86 domain-containing protein [Bacteroidota bacterium]
MPSMSEKDLLNSLAILEAIEKIEQYSHPHQSAEQWVNDQKSYDACLMNFVVIGEMSAKMSSVFLEQHKNIEWNKIKAFRNIIAHDYLGIDSKEVWQIVQNKLPDLKIQLKQITGK